MDFLAYRYYRDTGYHFHLARFARNHVIRGFYLRDITLQVSPFLASILERDQYLSAVKRCLMCSGTQTYVISLLMRYPSSEHLCL